MQDFTDKKITVLGCARSGIAVAKLLRNANAEVLVSELQSDKNFEGEKRVFEIEGINYEFGGHTDKVLESDFIVVSPGIPDKIQILQKALKKGIPLYSEIEIASQFCEAPIVAITGSNGKTTTTSMLGKIFEKAEIPCVVAGNIGLAFSEVVHKVRRKGVAIIEVSSFQLERIAKFKPKVAMLLNLTPDHLDRYASFIDYVKAKKQIFKNLDEDDFFIYNFDDSIVAQAALETVAKKVPFSSRQNLVDGLMVVEDNVAISTDNQKRLFCNKNEIGIKGEHNLLNALAAISVAKIFEIPEEKIVEGLKEFKGVEHRLEGVATINGIEFINDSKATNVDSVWWALGSFDKPLTLIAGGKDKGVDFERLKEVVNKRVKNLILLGETANKLKKDLGSYVKGEVLKVETMHEAVRKAFELASEDEIVLLSPACSSFDMYENFEMRGKDFKNEVQLLVKEFGKNG
ncbi:MAG: UDP-N-acetylmuramoyl-L-alanine--D-glutamate ligase [Calditrichaeota bacterium]|nr:MAG: UDP-N-acetylmuramoyl-L-alanine--D-glutamate ligase [Calditrichota bacterium]